MTRFTLTDRLREFISLHGPRRVAPCFDSILWRLPATCPPRTASLTIDDGPHPASTPRLIEVLARHHITATFFLIGAHAAQYPELVRDIIAAGHEMGNHSATHRDGWRCSRRELWRDYSRGSRTLSQIAQQPIAWLRPPYGHFSWPTIAWSRRVGQRIVMWDAAPADYHPARRLEQLIAAWEKQVRTRSIVLLHDNAVAADRTSLLLEHMLPRALDQGWRFVPLPASERFPPQTSTPAA